MQPQTITSPLKQDFMNFLIRLGKIFSNMSIVLVLLCLCGIFSFVGTAIVILICVYIIIITVGTIFIINPDFFSLFTNVVEVTGEISIFFLENFYIFAGLTIATSILSLILLVLDRRTKHVARIVLSSVVLAVALICLIVIAVGVAG